MLKLYNTNKESLTVFFDSNITNLIIWSSYFKCYPNVTSGNDSLDLYASY